MIRVNLLKNFSGGTTTMSPSGTVAPSSGRTEVGFSAGAGAPAEVLVKLVVLIIPALGLAGFDYYNAEQRQRETIQLQAELEDAKLKLSNLKPQDEAVKKFQANKAELQKKIDAIRDISKARLKNVKALDALQSIMPPKAWLTKLSIRDNRCSLEGQAIEDIDVSTLMQGLEESVFFTNVDLKNVESEKTKDGVFKKFTIDVNLENM